MKVLRISDELHEAIKVEAEENRRTINAQGELLLQIGLNTHTAPIMPSNRQVEAAQRGDNAREQIAAVEKGLELGILQPVIPEKIASSASADDGSFLDATKGTAVAVARPSMKIAAVSISEQPCCAAKSPCRHWSWSSMREGYVNSLSGRFREAEV